MKMFQEANGDFSSMRFGMILCIATACYMGIVAIHTKDFHDWIPFSSVLAMFLFPVIGGKIVQKKAESTKE